MSERERKLMQIARAQGMFNLVGGAWPIVWLRGFERVFGPKEEEWLQKTSGALFLTTGLALLMTEDSPGSIRFARRLGIGAALSYLTIDLIYVPKGRLRKTYLLDALMETAWLYAWARASRRAEFPK